MHEYLFKKLLWKQLHNEDFGWLYPDDGDICMDSTVNCKQSNGKTDDGGGRNR